MLQQINLYRPEKKKKEFDLRFEQLVSVFQIYLLGLGLLTAYDSYVYYSDKQQAEALTKLHSERAKQLESISKKVPKEQTRQQIINKIEQFQREIQGKERIYSMLALAQKSRISGYASYLESLAKLTVQGLWLTEFVFKNNGQYMLLEGKAVEPNLVPELITSLSASKDFSGKTFEVFKLNLDEESKHVEFILETKVAEAAP